MVVMQMMLVLSVVALVVGALVEEKEVEVGDLVAGLVVVVIVLEAVAVEVVVGLEVAVEVDLEVVEVGVEEVVVEEGLEVVEVVVEVDLVEVVKVVVVVVAVLVGVLGEERVGLVPNPVVVLMMMLMMMIMATVAPMGLEEGLVPEEASKVVLSHLVAQAAVSVERRVTLQRTVQQKVILAEDLLAINVEKRAILLENAHLEVHLVEDQAAANVVKMAILQGIALMEVMKMEQVHHIPFTVDSFCRSLEAYHVPTAICCFMKLQQFYCSLTQTSRHMLCYKVRLTSLSTQTHGTLHLLTQTHMYTHSSYVFIIVCR